ncbi:LuxR C-terminal-related transcriptional regulator [Aeromicrobium sp. UC242_57]|uniref:helix-turn-helix transcriptional regulator n=1 Tax=Aeromicrobium sp. UC242_57 TaxID=3374624 RepID=UPI00379DD68D
MIADAKATLTRLMLRSGADPEKTKIAFREVVADSRASGHVLGELRGLRQLAFVHYNAGELDEAEAVFAEGMRRADETGWSWGPYGFDGRFFGALVAYIRGRWDRVLELCAVSPMAPADARAGLAAVALPVAAARGEVGQIEQTLPMRSLWQHDEASAIHSGAALIELYGLRGDLGDARRVYDDVVGLHVSVWDDPDFPGRIRLASMLVGQYASAVGRLDRAHRDDLLAQLPELTIEVERAVTATTPFGPEGAAWWLRFQAEAARLTWLSVDAPTDADEVASLWQSTYDAFTALGEPYEAARSAARWAQVLLASGHDAQAADLVALARETAVRLGAEPLLASLPRVATRAVRPDVDLTPREREVLLQVAAGHSNGEIGSLLFISTKTVSVHVSNILAKLGAASRTEAAAIGRRKGLLD